VLAFNEERHEYRWHGRLVPSVTQILKDLTDYSMVPDAVLNRKRDIGIAVHKAIELDLDGDLDESTIDPAWSGYFEGWLRFKFESGFIVAQAEHKDYSERYGYAGTLDLLGELPNTGGALIDTKTCAVLMPSVGPQTAAYAELAKKPRINRYALQLTPEGKYSLVACTDKSDWAVFQAALTLHRWRKQHG